MKFSKGVFSILAVAFSSAMFAACDDSSTSANDGNSVNVSNNGTSIKVSQNQSVLCDGKLEDKRWQAVYTSKNTGIQYSRSEDFNLDDMDTSWTYSNGIQFSSKEECEARIDSSYIKKMRAEGYNFEQECVDGFGGPILFNETFRWRHIKNFDDDMRKDLYKKIIGTCNDVKNGKLSVEDLVDRK